MIRIDAAHGFEIPIPDGANFVEVSMPPAVLHARREARQAHPNASTLPPMVEVERGTMKHLNAILRGGVVFVKEDPLNPTILDDAHPLKAILSDLPEWPENPKSQGKGKRVRCDAVQTEVLEGVIHQLLEAGVIPSEIGRELAPWTGQTSRAIQARIRNMRRGMEVAQQVAA